MATVIGGPWPEHLNSPANTYYQTRPVMTMTSSLVTTHWGRVPSVHRTCYPALAWPIKLLAYAMPSVPVPPIMLLTDVVPRCRLLAAHGLTSCLSARTQPLTATGAPSQTSTMPCHAMPRRKTSPTSFSSVHAMPCISNPACIGFYWAWLELFFAQSGLQWVGNTHIIEKSVKKLKTL